jgi:DNA-binding NarL/FixJ family response regulator
MHRPLEPHPRRSALDKLRLVIADDHAPVREGLRRLIDGQDDMGIVGEARNGTEAVRLVAELRPSILLVDLSMPDLTGVQVTLAVRAATPASPVIGVTRDRDPRSVAAMFAAGAAGYVLKQSASSELLRAIRTVAAGRDFVDPALLQDEARGAARIGQGDTRSELASQALDDLERAVLDLFAGAHTDRDIADRLSVGTADVHAARIRGMEKAGLRTRVQVVEYVRARRPKRHPSDSD